MSERLFKRSILTRIASLPFFPVRALRAQPTVLEEIVVTATKRVEYSRDVPLSIMTVSGEAITSNGIESQHDVALVVPNLTITS